MRRIRKIIQEIALFHQEEKGQAMTEYAVLLMVLVVPFLTLWGLFVTFVNDYYDVCAIMISLPFP